MQVKGGDARHVLLQDSLLGALAVQVIWGSVGRPAGRSGRWTSGESLRVWTVDRLTQRARRLSGAG